MTSIESSYDNRNEVQQRGGSDMIRDELVSLETAKLAKEKGFPLQKVIKQDGRAFFYELPQSHPVWANCDAWYLPTQSLLQRWLREEKGIDIAIVPLISEVYSYIVYNILDRNNRVVETNAGYKTYELALEDALDYSLKNLV